VRTQSYEFYPVVEFYDGGIVCADDTTTGERFVTAITASRLKKYSFPIYRWAFVVDGHPERWNNPGILAFEVGDRVTFDLVENDGYPYATNVQFINPPSEWEQRVRLSVPYEATRDKFESTYGWRETNASTK
jgi:hypothetical protein